jgi:ribosome assembly protein RRB1
MDLDDDREIKMDEEMQSDDDLLASDDDEESAEDDDQDGDEEETGPAEAYVPGSSRPLEAEEELVMDESAYVIYHQAHLGMPCLSFDVVEDGLGEKRGEFPLSLFGVAGTQAESRSANSVIVFKMHNLHPFKKRKDDEDDEEDDEPEDEAKKPMLKRASIRHDGPINRVRFKSLGPSAVAAAWAEKGTVAIWNLTKCLQKLDEPGQQLVQGKDCFKDKSPPLFQFRGHLMEGFSMCWSPTEAGVLATGDCRKNIHVWRPADAAASWNVDQRPLVGHTASVEDLQWSPNEANVLASCSVDKTIRIWDCRAKPDQACMLTVRDSHTSDVNVIDWNRNEPFIVSGGDDGFIKVWDLRQLEKGEAVAAFKHHSAPVTSVEWHPTDATVLASSGADDQIVLWDLALEKDEEANGAADQAANDVKDLPPQLLFIHQGLQDIKEIHWHKQIPGLMMSTSHSGLDVFRTISV